MRALCWHGKGDVRVDTVPDPKIQHPRDAIIKITACAICGSDLHLLDGYQPTMESGDILGHENMGEVVEVGSEVTNLQNGRPRRRALHDQLRPMLVLPEGPVLVLRPDQSERRNGAQGDGPLARRAVRFQPYARRLFGRSGRISARADGRRRSDQGPDSSPTNRRCSSPTFSRPDTWQPKMRISSRGDTVAIWGCGPVGQFAIRSALMLGAGRVIAIDEVPERLAMAEAGGAETIDFSKTDVYDELMTRPTSVAPTAASTPSGAKLRVTELRTRCSTR